MEKREYIALKKAAIQQAGADDADSLLYYADMMMKPATQFKWFAIILGVVGIPFSFVGIGIFMIIFALIIYFFMHRPIVKKVEAFKQHVASDTDLTPA